MTGTLYFYGRNACFIRYDGVVGGLHDSHRDTWMIAPDPRDGFLSVVHRVTIEWSRVAPFNGRPLQEQFSKARSVKLVEESDHFACYEASYDVANVHLVIPEELLFSALKSLVKVTQYCAQEHARRVHVIRNGSAEASAVFNQARYPMPIFDPRNEVWTIEFNVDREVRIIRRWTIRPSHDDTEQHPKIDHGFCHLENGRLFLAATTVYDVAQGIEAMSPDTQRLALQLVVQAALEYRQAFVALDKHSVVNATEEVVTKTPRASSTTTVRKKALQAVMLACSLVIILVGFHDRADRSLAPDHSGEPSDSRSRLEDHFVNQVHSQAPDDLGIRILLDSDDAKPPKAHSLCEMPQFKYQFRYCDDLKGFSSRLPHSPKFRWKQSPWKPPPSFRPRSIRPRLYTAV